MKKQGPRTRPDYDNCIHGRHDYDTEAYPGEPEESIAFRIRAADALYEKMTRKPRPTTIETVLREVRAVASAIATTPRPTPTTASEPAAKDGPEGGRWVRYAGKRHDVPTGVVYRIIAHMWGRDAASYDDDLARNVFDDLPAPQTVRARASEVNLVLRRIGAPWRLRCDASARTLTKEISKNP